MQFTDAGWSMINDDHDHDDIHDPWSLIHDHDDDDSNKRESYHTWVPRLSSDVRAPLAVSQTLIRVPLLLAVANRVPANMIAMMLML